MTMKKMNSPSRSDRALFVALGVVIATVSAACGAATNYNPSTDKKLVVATAVVQPAEQVPVALPQQPSHASLRAEDAIMTKVLAEHRCLSEALYYEARGEGKEGQKAVAEVILRRVQSGKYGNSICSVVYEGANRSGCQFSFACNGQMAARRSAGAWRNAQALAARILTGEERLRGITGSAMYFHAISVAPGWSNTLTPTAQVGNHIFYSNRRRAPVEQIEQIEQIEPPSELAGSESF